MIAIRIAIARMRALFRRDAMTDEIREELQFHVEMRADEYARHGLDARAARQAALRRFGNPAVIQDRGYDVRGGGVMETMLQDVKYALRQLQATPTDVEAQSSRCLFRQSAPSPLQRCRSLRAWYRRSV
jgi:hypothetical protein